MHYDMKRIFRYILLIIAATFSAACTDYDDYSQSGIPGPSGKAKFSVKLPEGNTVNVTVSRSVDENAIKSIDLFFFEKKEVDGKKEWVYNSHSTAKIDTKNKISGLCEFEAEVPKGTAVITHLIANYDFKNLTVDNQNFLDWINQKTVNQFAEKLLDTRHIQPFNDSNDLGTNDITMWGYQGETTFKTNNQGVVTNNIDNIDMRRDVAKVTVKLSDEEIAKDRFHLTQVMVYNPMDKAYVIPVIDATTTDYPEGYPRAEQEFHDMANPSIPEDAVHMDDKWYVSDDHTPLNGSTDFTGVPNSYNMYVFPCWNTKDKTNGGKAVELQRDKRLFLILKGLFKYQGRWIEGYYRVDIATITYSEGSSYIKDFTLWDLTRKDNYVVTLKEVSGPGYSSPEDAKAAPMSNLIIMDMTTEPTGSVISAISNGQYRMAVSNPETYFFQDGNSNDVNAGWREGAIHLADLYLHSLLTEDNLNKGSEGGQQTNKDILNEAQAQQPTLSEPFNDPNTVKSIKAEILGEGYGDDYYQGTDLIKTDYNSGSAADYKNQYVKGLRFNYVDKDGNGKELEDNEKHVEIWIYRNSFNGKNEKQNRLRTIRITAGNLIRDLRIYQGKKGTFTFGDAVTGLDTQQYPTYYIGWEARTKLEVPITVNNAIIPASGLKCRVNLNYGGLGFMSLQGNSTSGLITIDAKTKQTKLELITTAAYYSTQKDIYRTNQIAITAKGMEDGVFAVKQSKFLDGVTGYGITGGILANDDTEMGELDFGYVEQDWQATVENGKATVDWLKIYPATDDTETTKVEDDNRKLTGKRQMRFKYQMTQNTNTTKNRYCKVVLKYGNIAKDKVTATHTIYFQQGLNDIEVNGVKNHGSGLVSGGWIENFGTRHWMCYNVNPGIFRKGYEDKYDQKRITDYPNSPEDPGIMFQFENIDDLYYGSGLWGKDYATAYAQLSNSASVKKHFTPEVIKKMKTFYNSTWNANGGKRTRYGGGENEWTDWGYGQAYDNVNPCPKGYRIPKFYEWQGVGFEINGYNIGAKIENKKQNSGKLLIAKNGGFDYAYWGRITFGQSDVFRAGTLLVGEDASTGEITKMLFFPAAGTLSQTLSTQRREGALLTTHYQYIDSSPEYNFGNQGGTYWASNPKLFASGDWSGISCVEIYHDPSHNIGILPNQTYGFPNVYKDGGYMSIHDAMPVRCIRNEND